jgi:hypothetical protein
LCFGLHDDRYGRERHREDFRKICSKISVRSVAFGQRRRRCEATAAEPPSVLGERGFKRVCICSGRAEMSAGLTHTARNTAALAACRFSASS